MVVRGKPIHKGARFSGIRFDARSGEPGAPGEHPFARLIRFPDEETPAAEDIHEYWGRDDPERTLYRLYTQGRQLPTGLTMRMAKPKSANKLGDFLVSNYLVVSEAARELFEAKGVRASYLPVTIEDAGGAVVEKAKHTLVVPEVVREWIDWERSDIQWTRSCTIWGYWDLACKPELGSGTEPLVRVANSRIHLMHRELLDAALGAGLTGLDAMRLDERALAITSDDMLADWGD